MDTTLDAPMGRPMLISDIWIDLPSNIDAAFTGNKRKLFFFKGSQYWRYTGINMDAGYPKKISQGFEGIPDNIDAVMRLASLETVYFFKGNVLFGCSKTYHLQMIFKLG